MQTKLRDNIKKRYGEIRDEKINGIFDQVFLGKSLTDLATERIYEYITELEKQLGQGGK